MPGPTSLAGALACCALIVLWTPAHAADVKATQKGGTLVLVGDADPNALSIAQAGVVTVTPTVGTLNGGGPQDFTGVNSISIKLGGGADAVSLLEVLLAGQLSIDGGDGDSDIDLNQCAIDKNLSIRNRSGNDDIRIEDTTVGGKVKIDNGDGGSQTDIVDDSLFQRDLQVKNRDGNDSVFLTDSEVGGKVKIQNGEGPGRFQIQAGGTIGKAFAYKGGGGDDTVGFDGGEISGKIQIDAGAGENEITASSSFTATRDLTVRAGNDDDQVYLIGPLLQARVRLDLGGGAQDWIDIDQSAVLQDDLTIKSRADDVRVFLDSGASVAGTVSLKSGAASLTTLELEGHFGDVRAGAKESLTVTTLNSVISGDVRLKAGGAAGSAVTVESTLIQGDLSWSSRDGDDEVDLVGLTTVDGRFSALLGDGVGDVEIRDAAVHGDVVVKGKKDRDIFELRGDSAVGGDVRIDFAQGDCFSVISPESTIRSFGGDIEMKCKEAAGDDCNQLVGNADVAGRVRLTSGAGACAIEINDGVYPRFDLDTGSGDDFVGLDAKSGAPAALFGPTRVALGKGNDTLQVGNSGNASAEFQSTVRFDGGPGDDLLDHLGHGNVYPPGEPSTKGFETEQ